VSADDVGKSGFFEKSVISFQWALTSSGVNVKSKNFPCVL